MGRMVRDIPAGIGLLVEFGAATGKISQAILEAGTRPKDLTIIKLDLEFASLLRHRYPEIRVISDEAQSLKPQ